MPSRACDGEGVVAVPANKFGGTASQGTLHVKSATAVQQTAVGCLEQYAIITTAIGEDPSCGIIDCRRPRGHAHDLVISNRDSVVCVRCGIVNDQSVGHATASSDGQQTSDAACDVIAANGEGVVV